MSAKLAKPPVFDGTDTSRTTVLSWIFDVEQYLTLTDTPEDKQTKFAATYLSGVAKTWYITTYGDKGTVTPLMDFLKAFKGFFLAATETQDVYNSIEKLRQEKRSANEYVTEYKLLAAQVKDPPLGWIHYTFLRGLDHTLAEAVVNDIGEKDDLDTSCAKTLKKAAITQLVNAIQPDPKRNAQSNYSLSKNVNTTAQRSPVVPRSNSANKSTIQPGNRKPKLGKLTDAEREVLAANKGCFLYRKVNAGHIALNCPERKGGEGSSIIKKEEVSIVDGYVVRCSVPSESDADSDSYSSVPIITIPTRIQQAAVDATVDAGATINVISPRTVKEHSLV